MTLQADAFRVQGKRTSNPCRIAVVLESLDPSDREVLEKALAAPLSEVRHTRIEEVLAGEDIKVTQNVIGRHRRGVCSCGR